MLIISHRGAAGLAPENTMAALKAGYKAGADILEFDVRLTKDNIPVVVHDAWLLRTHGDYMPIHTLTYKELREHTKQNPVPSLETVLDKYFGLILLNIELKSRGASAVVLGLLKKKYIQKASDWDKVIISSFKGMELVALRRMSKRVNLCLLHRDNPFLFIAFQRFVRLTAVGFHRLYLNRFALAIAKRSGLFIYAYTVNRTAALVNLAEHGVEGIVTNYPDKFRAALDMQSKD